MFTAPWCAPCKPVARALARARAAVSVGRGFAEVGRRRASPRRGMRFGVLTLPTVVILRDDEAMTVIDGARRRGDYERALEEVLPAAGGDARRRLSPPRSGRSRRTRAARASPRAARSPRRSRGRPRSRRRRAGRARGRSRSGRPSARAMWPASRARPSEMSSIACATRARRRPSVEPERRPHVGSTSRNAAPAAPSGPVTTSRSPGRAPPRPGTRSERPSAVTLSATSSARGRVAADDRHAGLRDPLVELEDVLDAASTPARRARRRAPRARRPTPRGR